MDIGFILYYIITPIVIGIGIVTGMKENNHLQLGMMLGIKGMFYLICAIVNVVHYYGGTWSERYVIGLTVALSIMEGLAGMRNCAEEYILDYKEKNNWDL